MGLFDLFKQTPSHILTYSPGGSTLNVRITYDTQTGLFTYRGRYGVREKFYDKDIVAIENREVSRTHRVLLIQGANHCIATFDVLTNLVCQNLEAWISSKGTIAYDYDEQQKGRWINSAAVKAAIEAGPPKTEEDPSEKVVDIDPFESIKKLKDLFDIGAISEEEFTTKKEELLRKI